MARLAGGAAQTLEPRLGSSVDSGIQSIIDFRVLKALYKARPREAAPSELAHILEELALHLSTKSSVPVDQKRKWPEGRPRPWSKQAEV